MGMVEETVAVRCFEDLCCEADKFLCRSTSVIPETPNEFLVSTEEIIRELLENKEPLLTMVPIITEQEICDHLRNVSEAEKQIWMQECDAALTHRVSATSRAADAAATPAPSNDSTVRQANSTGPGEFDDCGWDFHNMGGKKRAPVELTTALLYDDSASNRDSSSLPPPPDAITFDTQEEEARVADRSEAYEVYFRCKAIEVLQRDKIVASMTSRLGDRARGVVEKLNNGKRIALQALLDHLRHETSRSRAIVSRIPQLSSAVITESFHSNPNVMVYSRNTSDCEECHKAFGMIVRRHHCRRCGRCLCNECSCCLGFIPIKPDDQVGAPPTNERLCNRCYDKCHAYQEQFFDVREAQFYCEERRILDDTLPRFCVVPPDAYASLLSATNAQILLHRTSEGTAALAQAGAEYCSNIFRHAVGFIQENVAQQRLIEHRR